MKYSKYYGSEYAPDPFFCIEVLEKQIAALTDNLRIFNPCGHSPFESTVCGKCGYPDPIKVISALTAKNERLKEACKRVLFRRPIGGLAEDVLLEDDDLKLIQAALAGEEKNDGH